MVARHPDTFLVENHHHEEKSPRTRKYARFVIHDSSDGDGTGCDKP